MLNVLMTIDAETYPLTSDWKQDHLASDIKRDLYGEVGGHSVGLDYQLRTLAKHALKANFMVESLFAAVPEVGPEPLREIVRSIRDGGHDIQLHPHPEWISHVPELDVPFRSHLLRAYSLDEQEAIIRFATQRLLDAGAPNPVAFRAGGFAANADTLAALLRCGIRYDSSFNRCYREDGFQLAPPTSFGHATDYNGVAELPVTVFQDYFSHFRPAQLCACSSAEMIHALRSAESEGWDFFVIVSHSFEMIKRRRHPTKPPAIRWDVVARFEALCEFLSSNRDRFTTVGFSNVTLSAPGHATANIKGKLSNTISRIYEQAVSRIRTL